MLVGNSSVQSYLMTNRSFFSRPTTVLLLSFFLLSFFLLFFRVDSEHRIPISAWDSILEVMKAEEVRKADLPKNGKELKELRFRYRKAALH